MRSKLETITAVQLQAPSPGATGPRSGGRRDMNQTCDRCGPAVRAVYRVARQGELYLCRHCTVQLRAALSAQGWAIWLVGQPVLVP
jgi:ribosomal protein S14